jgi:hypothetical protein
MKNLRAAIIGAILGFQAIVCVAEGQPPARSYRPAAGYIPDKATAVAVAIAVLIPIYGKETVDSEMPFKVVEKKGVWIITGAPPPAPGGSAEIHISKANGRILFVTHYN